MMTPQQSLASSHHHLVYYALHGMPQLRDYPDHDGLVGAGCLGLVKAANDYQAGRGVPFPAYALIRIKGALLDEVRSNYFGGRHARSRMSLLREAEVELWQTLSRSPTSAELAAHLGWAKRSVGEVRAEIERSTYLSLDLGAGSAAMTPSTIPEPEKVYEEHERNDALRAAVEQLNEKQRAAVYGVYFQGRLQQQVADELGVTASRVCQLLRESASKLRNLLDPIYLAA